MQRRDFLKTTAVGAAISTLSPALAHSQMQSLTGKKMEHPVLSKLREKIEPIPPEERSERQERARALMAEFDMDAIVCEGGTTLYYYTGVQWGRSERLFAMILPKEGEPLYIAPKFEESRAVEQLGSAKLYTWEEHENPYLLLKKVLKDAHRSIETLGIEETTRYFVTEGIAEALPSLNLVNATPVTAGCRSVKSDRELALMQIANEATMEIFKLIPKMLMENMTEQNLSRAITQTFAMHGFQGGALVLFGKNSAHPHGIQKENKLRIGDTVLIDGGCAVEGYVSDITRTMVFYAKPTEKQQRVFDIVKKAQSAALAEAKPGVAAEDIDAAAREVIEDAGFGPDYKYFTHRLGHGIGLEGHEWYYLVRGSKRPVVHRNVFSNEPGIYIPDEFGIRIEDEMLITEDGAKLLLPQAETLEDFFGVKVEG